VADPAPSTWLDLGAVLGDVAGLYGHEARRRRVALEVQAPRGLARTVCGSPERAVRLILFLVGQALEEAREGGRVEARVTLTGDKALLTLLGVAGDPGPDTGYDTITSQAAAAALGGSLEVERVGGQARLVLALPRGGRE
jgi:signal transduction histidine kinase